ncbi:MAG TPA: transglycosylase domain-containing protein, partial [Vicinamibacteria bacterium]|nr:transglycosylase domain-containing protein [Vicinamibacteria bacterium]
MPTLEFMKRSVALSTWLSRHWTIEDLLDAYADTAWMGEDRRGFEAGAQYYWGRALDALAPHEIATLIAVSDYARPDDPACRPDRALRMREAVLESMLDARVIDDAAFRQATAAPLRVVPTCPSTRSGPS